MWLVGFWSILTLAVAYNPAVARSELAEPTQINERLDRVINQAIANHRIVGAVVIVAQDGIVVYRRAAGFADREAAVPMRTNSIFRLASMTKPLVTVAAMRLVEQGRLDLDDPVTKWLSFFTPGLPDGRRPPILIRDLLRHSSGLTYSFFESDNGPYRQLHVLDGPDGSGITLDEDMHRLSKAPLLFRPGTQWHYGLSIDVLGEVIEKVTDTDLAAAVSQLVTGPLALKDTDFVVTDRSRLTTAYADGKPNPIRITSALAVPFNSKEIIHFVPDAVLSNRSYPSGGGGMAGTAEDYIKFLEAIRLGGAPLLKHATAELMMSDQIGEKAEAQGPGWGFGFGGAVLDDPVKGKTPQSRGTFQWGGAYGHIWWIDPARKLSVVSMTNTTPEGMSGQFIYALRDAIYGSSVVLP